jgi:peptidoglycan hydrolase-like protein with peptidoglycan-binding domain
VKRRPVLHPWRYVVASFLFVVVGLSPSVPGVQADDHHVRPGDRGPAVVDVQASLRSYGYTVTLDGRYGPQTLRAVRHWQRANGLDVDGIVGPETLTSLHPAAATVPARRVDPPDLSPVEAIRAVWPDDLEDRALAIAYRESRYVPTAANACCYGLFQVHYNAHRAWLGEYGVTRPSDLFDPTTNARVAFALYQAAGWDPWRL